MNELKKISRDAVPRALELAERYRLLNEPEQSASICNDILEVEPDNEEALRTLFLATTEQFGKRRGTSVEDAEKIAERMKGEYERAYYSGIICERWARTKLQENAHASLVGDWLHRAMRKYQEAEALRPAGNDDAVLRWNSCVRLIERVPELKQEEREHAMHFED